jgi:translation initiation factor IF-2
MRLAEGDAEEAGEEAADEADVAVKAQPESPLPEPVEESPAVVETQPPPEKDAAVTKRKRAEAAKVIAKPESVVPEESPAPAKTEPEVVDVAAEPDDIVAEDKPPEAPATEAATPPEETAVHDDAAAETATPAPPAVEKPVKKPKAKAKKAKKEAAAKIIKLPTRPVIPEKPAMRPDRRRSHIPAGAKPLPTGSGRRPHTRPLPARTRKEGWRQKGAGAGDQRFTKKRRFP